MSDPTSSLDPPPHVENSNSSSSFLLSASLSLSHSLSLYLSISLSLILVTQPHAIHLLQMSKTIFFPYNTTHKARITPSLSLTHTHPGHSLSIFLGTSLSLPHALPLTSGLTPASGLGTRLSRDLFHVRQTAEKTTPQKIEIFLNL